MKDLSTSVIIPTFNRATYLEECITAVLQQTLKPNEIIIVDNGSTDNTPSVLEKFKDQQKTITTTNIGKAAALNLALKQIQNPLVWIIDDDDLVLPDALDLLVQLLETDSNAGFSYGRHTRFQSINGISQDLGTGYWDYCTPNSFHLSTMEDFFVHQPSLLVKKELYNKVGEFDETLIRSQDYDMLVRLANASSSVSTEKVLFKQRVHDGKRGLKNHQIESNDREAVWVDFDKEIFRKLDTSLPLNKYLPKTSNLSPQLSQRTALIQRGCIMGRKKLWAKAIRDFKAAAKLSCLEPISSSETKILKRTFSSKYGCLEIINDKKIIEKLCIAANLNSTSGVLVSTIADGLRWRVKENFISMKFRLAFSYMFIFFRLKIASHKAKNSYTRTTSDTSSTAIQK